MIVKYKTFYQFKSYKNSTGDIFAGWLEHFSFDKRVISSIQCETEFIAFRILIIIPVFTNKTMTRYHIDADSRTTWTRADWRALMSSKKILAKINN